MMMELISDGVLAELLTQQAELRDRLITTLDECHCGDRASEWYAYVGLLKLGDYYVVRYGGANVVDCVWHCGSETGARREFDIISRAQQEELAALDEAAPVGAAAGTRYSEAGMAALNH